MEENVERDRTKKGDFNGRWGERQGRGHHMLGGIYQLVCTLHAAGRSGECPNVALASATEIHPDRVGTDPFFHSCTVDSFSGHLPVV